MSINARWERTERSGRAGQGPSLLLRDPDGNTIELIGGMTQVARTYGPLAVQPRNFSHVTLLVDDCQSTVDFYQVVLGFRVSDWVDTNFVWLRCNPDHHGLAFAKTGSITLRSKIYAFSDVPARRPGPHRSLV